jgi:hypothetical protein
MLRKSLTLWGCVLFATLRCSLNPQPEVFGRDDGSAPEPPRGDPTTPGTGGSNTDGSGSEPPPENENDTTYLSPVATGLFVWSANPSSDRVARINARTLAVESLDAGDEPTYLTAVPSSDGNADRVAVLNLRSQDASIFTAVKGGGVLSARVPVHAGANAWAVTPKGRFAIAWSDASRVKQLDPTEGLQDITLIALPTPGSEAPPRAWRLNVGYRPSRVFVSADERRAFVVAEPGITVIDLTADTPSVVEELLLAGDGTARDVSITPDGQLALVRYDGESKISVLALADGKHVEVTLGGPVTDLDLLADGSRAIAVVRDTGATEGAGGAGGAPQSASGHSEVAVLSLDRVLANPSDIDRVEVTGTVVGSVSASLGGEKAVLYTTTAASQRLVILDTQPGERFLAQRVVNVKSRVQAVFPAPDAKHAIALLTPDEASSSRPGAFAVVPIAEDLPPRIQGTDAPPVAVAIAPAPSLRAIVTTSSAVQAAYSAYVVRMPELQVDRVALASPPLATGLVPEAAQAFVSQQHASGRITFIDLAKSGAASELARTLTGFELGDRVVGANGGGQ